MCNFFLFVLNKKSCVSADIRFLFKILCSPTYNVSLEQILVGDNVSDVSFSAIFDSGTSFTYLNDPAYTVISKSVSSLNNLLIEYVSNQLLITYSYVGLSFSSIPRPKRSGIPLILGSLLSIATNWGHFNLGTQNWLILVGFFFWTFKDWLSLTCSLNQTSFEIPSLNFTMQGGKQFSVTDPIVQLSIEVMFHFHL